MDGKKRAIYETINGHRFIKERGKESDHVISPINIEFLSVTEDIPCTLGKGALYILDDEREWILVPDLSLHFSRISREAPIRSMADLVVECVSDRDHQAIINQKVSYYMRNGAAVWLVNEHTGAIEVRKYGEATKIVNPGQILEDRELLPGFQIKIPNP